MASYNFSAARILLADPQMESRQMVRDLLRAIGARDIETSNNLENLKQVMSSLSQAPDLLLFDTELKGGDACELIHAIRHDEFGSFPFLPIVALTWHPSNELVKKTIDSGVDRLLVKPLSRKILIDCIDLVVEARKPFVVTTEYIGPDRRDTETRRIGMEIPLIDVPNILKAKITGTGSVKDMQAQVDAALNEIRDQKVERHAYQIDYLTVRIIPGYAERKQLNQLLQYLDRLHWVAKDSARRVALTHHAHLAELFHSVLTVAKRIRQGHPRPDESDLQILSLLATAVKVGTSSDKPEDVRMVGEIAKTVKKLEAESK